MNSASLQLAKQPVQVVVGLQRHAQYQPELKLKFQHRQGLQLSGLRLWNFRRVSEDLR
jgi:hypothetical protein